MSILQLEGCSLLLATDGSEFSSGAERVAFKIAELCKSKIYILQVLYYNPDPYVLKVLDYNPKYKDHLSRDLDVREKRAREVVERLVRFAQEKNLQAFGIVKHAETVEDGICQSANELNVNLIVMGRRGIRGLAKFFIGSASLGVLEKATCPVIIAPRSADIKAKGLLGATDGSETSEKALRVMFNLALKLDVPTYIVTVCKNEKEKERGERNLERASQLSKDFNGKSELILRLGEPAEEILKVAQEKDVDLIVIGSRNLKGVSKMVLGSVSEKVVSKTDRAVLVVK